MVIALAGRRIDAPDAEVSRFPASMKGEVRQRLLDFFRQQGAAALVCSGACGADLLALDAAGELRMRRRMVLPFPPQRFRSTSVTDRSDPAWWGSLFDRMVEALPPGDLVVLQEAGEDAAAYAAANEAILDEALRLARNMRREARAVIVWEGAPRSEDDATANFARAARARDLDVDEMLTR